MPAAPHETHSESQSEALNRLSKVVHPGTFGLLALAEVVRAEGPRSEIEERFPIPVLAWDMPEAATVRSLRPDQRERAARYLALGALPPALRAEIAGGTEKHSDTEILDRLGGTGGTSAVSLPTLGEFARWHLENQAKRQTAFEATQLPRQRKFFRQAIVDAAQSWLPKKAIDKLGHVETARVYLDDGFDTLLKGGHGRALNVNKQGSERPTIVVAPNAKTPTFVHEFSHLLDGQDDIPPTEQFTKAHTGLYRIFGTGAGGEAIDEAVAEHFASSLLYGHVGVTDPYGKHRWRDRTHVFEGELLHALCTKGIRKISPRLFIDAKLEDGVDRDAAGDNSAQAKLVRALHESFPDDDIVQLISGPDFITAKWHAFDLNKRYEIRRIFARLTLKRRSR